MKNIDFVIVEKMTLKKICESNAVDISDEKEARRGLFVIGYSKGTYCVTSVLLSDKDGNLFKITKRNDLMFKYIPRSRI